MSLADQLLLFARCLVKEHCNLYILHAAPPWPVSSTMARVVTGLSRDAQPWPVSSPDYRKTLFSQPWPVSSRDYHKTLNRGLRHHGPCRHATIARRSTVASSTMARVFTGLSQDAQPWLCLHTGPIGEACKCIKLHIEIFKI